MKTNIIILSICIALLALASLIVFNYQKKYEAEKTECENLNIRLDNLNKAFDSLSDSFGKLSRQKSYTISLAPNINSKITSTFGSAKNLTFHYYFTMNGNSQEIFPDSVYQFSKIE